MAIDFRMRDFAYPLSIYRMKRIFDKNQWLGEEALYQYQSEKLRQAIMHAYNNVPYYQKLFKKNNILPSDIKSVKDLKNIPFLGKDTIRHNFNSLIAHNAEKYKPQLLSSSGTTGRKIDFYVDKPSNILEFVYYWRSWGWAGYKLGDTFASLSSEFFLFFKKNKKALYHFNPLTKNLTINCLFISRQYSDNFAKIFKKYNPLFLKGNSMNLYLFALLFHDKKKHSISFKAIFSQGTTLLQYQKEFIEKVFSCKVFDLYGHMERTVAISQCPSGTYHIHSDYGIVEFEEPQIPFVNENDKGTCIKEIIGTSLYNLSMPLIRYKTGDFVKIKRSPEKCSCQRGFPTIISVIGRQMDIIITPDRRTITGINAVFNHTPGIFIGQVIQEDIYNLLVKIVPDSEDIDHINRTLMNNIRDFVGDNINIKIEHTTIEGIRKDSLGKFKLIVSNIPLEKIFN